MVYVHKPGLVASRLSRAQSVGLLQLAALGAAQSVLLFHGVWLCGPLRALLLTQHHDSTVLAALGTLFSEGRSEALWESPGAGGPARMRGVALFVAAVVALLFLDHDEGAEHLGSGHSFLGPASWLGLADHKVGVCVLLCALVAGVGMRAVSRRLAPAVAGPKSLHAVCTLLEGVMLLPWTLVLLCTQGSGEQQRWVLTADVVIQLLAVAVFMLLLAYYVDSACCQRLDVQQVARAGSLSVFTCALLVAACWPQEAAVDHSLSGGGVLACVLFMLKDGLCFWAKTLESQGLIVGAVLVVDVFTTVAAGTLGGRLSSAFTCTLGLTSSSRAGAHGSLLGFSSTGLPLYSVANTAHRQQRSTLALLSALMARTLGSPNSRRIFYFLCLNLSFTLVEFAYGLWTNSLGLISDAFHMLFDCSGLVLGLVAAVLSHRKPSKTFSYGYGRLEELSGLVNAMLLCVVSLLVSWEAVGRLLDPPVISTRRLLAVSTAGLAVNLVGIFVFRHSHGAHQHAHQHAHGNANMEGVFLHVLADTLGSVGVIVSSLLIDQFGWYVADPVCSLFIAALILLSVLPLLVRSAGVLLLCAPAHLRSQLPRILEQVLSVEGVLGLGEQFYWTHCGDTSMAMVHVRAAPRASHQDILRQVTAILKQAGFCQPCVQVDKGQFPVLPSATSLLLSKDV